MPRISKAQGRRLSHGTWVNTRKQNVFFPTAPTVQTWENYRKLWVLSCFFGFFIYSEIRNRPTPWCNGRSHLCSDRHFFARPAWWSLQWWREATWCPWRRPSGNQTMRQNGLKQIPYRLFNCRTPQCKDAIENSIYSFKKQEDINDNW